MTAATKTVFERMVAVVDELPAIGKTDYNEQQKFHFRGHDAVLNALNPLLAKHGVFVVPNVLERVTSERTTRSGSAMFEVSLHVAFTFYGATGDSFTGSTWGEGTDMGDKATSKAMTMAFKSMIGQAFAISTAENADPDASTPEESAPRSGADKVSSSAGTVGGTGGQAAVTAQTPTSEPPAASSFDGPRTASTLKWKYGEHAGKTLAETPLEFVINYAETGKPGFMVDKCKEFLAENGGSIGGDPDENIPFATTIDGLGN